MGNFIFRNSLKSLYNFYGVYRVMLEILDTDYSVS